MDPRIAPSSIETIEGVQKIAARIDNGYIGGVFVRDLFNRPPRYALLKEIQEIFSECHYENWDGYGAAPVTEPVANEGRYFLQMIPHELPNPFISPHPNGSLAFEWHGVDSKVFSASVAGKCMLYCSWYFNLDSKGHFREKLVSGMEFPEIALAIIKQVFKR